MWVCEMVPKKLTCVCVFFIFVKSFKDDMFPIVVLRLTLPFLRYIGSYFKKRYKVLSLHIRFYMLSNYDLLLLFVLHRRKVFQFQRSRLQWKKILQNKYYTTRSLTFDSTAFVINWKEPSDLLDTNNEKLLVDVQCWVKRMLESIFFIHINSDEMTVHTFKLKCII